MPFLGKSSSFSASEFEPIATAQYAQQIVSDAAYAASAFPRYSEKRLSEKLEPITVIEMGNLLYKVILRLLKLTWMSSFWRSQISSSSLEDDGQ
jgi:hypothetical protein